MIAEPIVADFAAQLARDELAVRLLRVGNRDADVLGAWVCALFETIEVHDYKGRHTANGAVLAAGCEGLVMAGQDARRLADIYRDFEVALRNKIVIAVTRGSSPQSRALLLRGGFDDVFDIERLQPLEAAARLRAISRRWRARISTEAERARLAAQFAAFCPTGGLSAREKRLIECLLERPGWCVPFDRLQRIASQDKDPISIKNLRVSMSILRHKLAAGARIEAIPHEGYVLVKDGEFGPVGG